MQKVLSFFYIGREKLTEAVLYLVSFTAVKIYLSALFFLNAANWLLAYYVNKSVSQTLVVLHYNVDLGVNLIGGAKDIYIIPTLGLSFIIINFLLLVNIYHKNKFIIHFILGFSILVNLFLIAGTSSIYLINFR